MKNTVRNLARRYSFYLGGDQPPVTWYERFRSAIGAFIGLMLVITIAMYLRELSGIDEWLMASPAHLDQVLPETKSLFG